MWVERVARGGSVFSGTLDWNFDTDNETEVSFLRCNFIVRVFNDIAYEQGYLILYHSQSGRNDDFSETPYRLKNMKFTDGVNSGVYNEMFYKNLHDCSNLEKIEQGFVPPFPRKIYEFRQCVPSTNGFPDVLPLGYYKIVVGFRGQVDIVITFIIKLKPKL